MARDIGAINNKKANPFVGFFIFVYLCKGLIIKLDVKTMLKKIYFTMKNKRFLIINIVVALLLLIPLIAMQFTDEVNWSSIDFLVMGFLLVSAVFAFEFVMKSVTSRKNRIILIVILLIVFLLVWAELAVGIFGTPLAGS